MPLIADEPPNSLPRGIGMRRWPVDASGSEAKSQLAFGLSINLAKPTGIHDQGWLSRPASSTSTLCRGSALSRLASTEPAEPAPTTMKSKIGWSIFLPRGLHRHKRSTQGERGVASCVKWFS
jgi:hypothetical protein